MPPKPQEVYRKLLQEGWMDAGGKGSHKKLRRGKRSVVVPMHRKDLAVGTWHKIQRDAGWK